MKSLSVIQGETCGWHPHFYAFQNHISNHIFAISPSSVDKESTRNAEDPGLIPGSGRSPGEGKDYPLQYSWASLMAQLVKKKIHLQCRWSGFYLWIGKISWRRERLPTSVFWPGESGGHKELDTTEWHSLSLGYLRAIIRDVTAATLVQVLYKHNSLLTGLPGLEIFPVLLYITA